MRAIFFDFDGVLADSEPIHFLGFQKILVDEGIVLTQEAYYKNYLGYDDEACLHEVYKDHGHRLSRPKQDRLIAAKTRYVKQLLRQKNTLLSGVRRVIPMLARRYPLAIVSGALRQEILLVVRQAALQDYFHFVVSAEDVKHGKPHPEGYKKALQLMNQKVFKTTPLKSRECLVFEDSHWGIQSAHAAGMPCVGLATSYSKKELKEADLVLKDVSEIRVSLLPHLKKLSSP